MASAAVIGSCAWASCERAKSTTARTGVARCRMLVMIEDFYTVGNGIINSFEFPDLSESKLGGLTVFRCRLNWSMQHHSHRNDFFQRWCLWHKENGIVSPRSSGPTCGAAG